MQNDIQSRLDDKTKKLEVAMARIRELENHVKKLDQELASVGLA